ncbi:MAG: hypothetical protein IPK87_00930 [Planctomycetes bacterium]|nr:hypothetical protein [Planctomycetota bacterium]
MESESENRIPRGEIWSAAIAEAGATYSFMAKVASLFLGGSVAGPLLSKSITPSGCSLAFLILAWIAFGLSVVLLVFVRWLNLEMLADALSDKDVEALGHFTRARRVFLGACFALGAGVVTIIVAVGLML